MKRWIFTGLALGFLIAGTVIVRAGLVYWDTCGGVGCPDVHQIEAMPPAETSVVYDRTGEPIADFFRVRRSIVSIGEVPTHLPAAFLAIEDQRFLTHEGIDWVRFVGALLSNLRSGDYGEGFSTITMQLARNLFPEALPREKTLRRKLAEMRVALEIERSMSKFEILERYLNQIYLGAGAYGVEAAAQEYFGKRARELTLEEAALLAALPQAPTRLNPRQNPQGARERRNQVLVALAEQGWISDFLAYQATDARLALSTRAGEMARRAPYFVEAVRQRMEVEFGDDLYTAGLRIHTTLDPEVQSVVEREVAAQMDSILAEHALTSADSARLAELQAAAIIMDAESGDVLGYLGGLDFDESEFDRVRMARRQPGSAFKPVVYLAALESGFPLGYPLFDLPISILQPNGERWQPGNYDGTYRGATTLHESLVHSRNIPTIWLMMDMGGPRPVARMAERMRVAEDVPAVPSVALGSVETSLLQLAGAYSTFANEGVHVEPRMVLRVEDARGRVLLRPDVEARRVVSAGAAHLLTRALEDVVDRGTAATVRRAGYRGPAAGKTGTTNNATDVWFMGYTPALVGGVWMGFDAPSEILPRATGGTLAAPVWARVMRDVASDTSGWERPDDTVLRRTYGFGGAIPAECSDLGDGEWAVFLERAVPVAECLAFARHRDGWWATRWQDERGEQAANFWATFRRQELGVSTSRHRLTLVQGAGRDLVTVDVPNRINVLDGGQAVSRDDAPLPDPRFTPPPPGFGRRGGD